MSYATPQDPVIGRFERRPVRASNRAGVQISAESFFPADVDPETKAPSYVLVPGTIFDQVDRWQRLELVQMLPTIERQARVLRASTRRPVQLDGAYLERVVVNLLGGPGESEVFLDDLEISRCPTTLLARQAEGRSRSGETAAGPATGRLAAQAGARLTQGPIRLERNLLEKRGRDGLFQPWFPDRDRRARARTPSSCARGLRRLDRLAARAIPKSSGPRSRGALIMARLSGATRATGPQRMLDQITAYPLRESVAFWHLGDHLGRQRADPRPASKSWRSSARRLAAMRNLDDDVSHLAIATVDGDSHLFARAPRAST